MNKGATMRRLGDPNLQGSLANGARSRRWREFSFRFPDLAAMRVLDLGGVPDVWRTAPERPAHVTTVNLTPYPFGEDTWLNHVVGDACDLPAQLRRERFDLVFSNSLIEHVGGHARRQQFSESVLLWGPLHWVQTPYRYFPIEPHWLFPGMQFLPHAARVFVSMHWRLGHIRTMTRAKAEEKVNEIELLCITQMRGLFPDSEIWHEQFSGLTKSLVAVRS